MVRFKKNLKVLFAQFIILGSFLCIWEIIGRISQNIAFFFGTPTAILTELKKLIIEDGLHSHFFITGSEAVVGLIIGTIFGSLVGLLLWYSETATEIARPFIIAVGTLPIFAFAPLMIVWFGVGFKMKVAMAAFSTVFVAFNQANKGANLVSSEYVDTMKGMNATRYQIFSKVIVPGSIDWVLSSMRLNVGFGLLGAFIGEFISSDKGLGYLILRAGGLYNIPRAFAAAIGITILALILDALARYIERNRHLIIQWISVPRLLWKK
ncbi:MAG: ABC transporter permease [Candidatus Scalindua rubra]|uniref:ABC transporter permease component n=1 Tax=Candidatus Scalindua brodae TaxID=237368 RepID=A0A0B0ESI8_9BACT|nr:MAG: ABC transporter permease component [Candidatus Scalindua brodae]MBZ0110373.1 ABC transporter permease [Candidatus Scalindua rubra]TWU33959.1 putative aliphatic sulfonates transport permease protein SsuC [Candidatus Brocadiaceae bacterium S225]